VSDARDVQAGEITVRLSHPGKVLFPDADVTKAELADYYLTVADTMLPHLRARPIAMERYPDGISGQRIFQKDVPAYFPTWVHRVTVKKQEGTLEQVVCENSATLVYLADLACITPHAWLSRIDRPDHPDQLIFDLDPAGDDFAAARAAALAVRALLDELDLPSFVKTTGQRGIHVTVPLDRSAGFDAVRAFARDVARELVARHPSQLTLEQRKDHRGGRLYLDLMRNGYAQTAVPPYAVRARPEATVATPLDWEELGDPSLQPAWFTLRTVPNRIATKPDPWAGMAEEARNLAGAGKRIRALGSERTAPAP
jgi:bifunctional non-homologous end joining protein LigD